GKAGLLIAVVAPEVVEALWAYVEADPSAGVTVDLASKTITAGDQRYEFAIDDFTRYRLLEGLDDISMTLAHEEDIASYEATRPSYKPKTLPARTAG
ncbi:MAG: 3-isopropylmalate dehydratase small subunit, partial [Propionibacteriaceae bacterium]|nr:3-isopropylmalate dehydratase small subunit [Propionibacteriaceae bacterium]